MTSPQVVLTQSLKDNLGLSGPAPLSEWIAPPLEESARRVEVAGTRQFARPIHCASQARTAALKNAGCFDRDEVSRAGTTTSVAFGLAATIRHRR